MLQLYMDVYVKAVITAGLRRRGIDVVTAQEDGGAHLEDVALLDRWQWDRSGHHAPSCHAELAA
jgi:hypothetical protein